MKAIQRLTLAVIGCLYLFGCGYTTSSTLPEHIHTIYVDKFINKIDFTNEARRNLYLPLLEVNVHNAITDRFLFDGNLKIGGEDSADLFLKGELLSYRRIGLRFTDNDDVEEYRVYITVRLELYNNDTQELMWTEESFVGEATYFVSGPQSSSEESAVREAIEDLARRIVERTVEAW
ncbi:MAG: LPS assembly lipoprotein LptE [Candidatus Omnitrophota bacterium]